MVADTQIGAGVPPEGIDQNFGASAAANSGVVPGSGGRQALFRFDLSAIPQGSAITSATVTLWESNDAHAVVRAHRITAPWIEGTVTWSSFAGAFDPAVAATFDNGGPGPGPTPVSFSIGALVQGWVNNPAHDQGFLLEQDPVGHTQYLTSELPAAGERPKLVVCYAAATCSDGIQDQDERGVDCGGSCPTDCAHPPSTEFVNAGDTSRSPHFKAVFTLGQPSQNQDKSTSPSYRAQGGLIGANGSLP